MGNRDFWLWLLLACGVLGMFAVQELGMNCQAIAVVP
jgi:hypothetical protein